MSQLRGKDITFFWQAGIHFNFLLVQNFNAMYTAQDTDCGFDWYTKYMYMALRRDV